MIIDIIVIAVLLISAFIAFIRGFIREVLTILGGFGGLLAAYTIGPLFSPIVQGWLGVTEGKTPDKIMGVLPVDMLGTALAYGGVFVLVVGILSFISHLLAESARSMGLGAIDRTLGVIFGLVRGVLMLGLLYLPFHLMLEQVQKDKWFASSKTHFYLEATSGLLAGFVPEIKTKNVGDNVENIAVGVRKKLEMIDVLKKSSPPIEGNKDATSKESGGYTEGFREDMDGLFEKKKEYNE